MKLHARLDDAIFAELVEFAAGNLAAESEQEWAAHVLECATCDNALSWIRPLSRRILTAPEPIELPDEGARLWERIETQVEGDLSVQPWKHWSTGDHETSLVRQAASSEWRRTSIDGIEVRELSADPAASNVTMLIRMAPGTHYPAHEHGGPEECYVLQGDLVIGEIRMLAGDFQRMERGTVHPDQHTESGCLLFLRSSMDDRLTGAR